MRAVLIIAAVAALASCGPTNPEDDPAGRADTRQQPTDLTPGVSISGYANIGVKKRF